MRLEMIGVGGGMGGGSERDEPSVTATVKFRARDLLLELLPIGQSPTVHFEVLDIMAQVGHVLCGECLICEAG